MYEPDLDLYYPVRAGIPVKAARTDKHGNDLFDANGHRIFDKTAEFGDLAIVFTGESRAIILDITTTHPQYRTQLSDEYGTWARKKSQEKTALYTKYRNMTDEDILPIAYETSGYMYHEDYKRFNGILFGICKKVPGVKLIIPGADIAEGEYEKKENISVEGKRLYSKIRKDLRLGVSNILQTGNARALVGYSALQDGKKANA